MIMFSWMLVSCAHEGPCLVPEKMYIFPDNWKFHFDVLNVNATDISYFEHGSARSTSVDYAVKERPGLDKHMYSVLEAAEIFEMPLSRTSHVVTHWWTCMCVFKPYSWQTNCSHVQQVTHIEICMPRSVIGCLAAPPLAHEMSANPVFLLQPTKAEVKSQPEKACNPGRAQYTAWPYFIFGRALMSM